MPVKLPDDPLPWECLDQDYLFRRPPWLVLRHQRFRLPSGREISDYWQKINGTVKGLGP